MTERCQNCASDLSGDPIPEKSRHLYGGKTHFSRKIGIYNAAADRTETWKCPDCGFEWSRQWMNTTGTA